MHSVLLKFIEAAQARRFLRPLSSVETFGIDFCTLVLPMIIALTTPQYVVHLYLGMILCSVTLELLSRRYCSLSLSLSCVWYGEEEIGVQ